MNPRQSYFGWKLGAVISLVVSGALTYENCTLAQVLPDGTLGIESSVVKSNVDINGAPSDRIDGGAIRGTNLFHSFREFNVGEGQSVYFNPPPGINNILSRVTGGSSSQILGKLGVLGNANLFLINPNGIIFGPNSSLDLKGSFLASTANSLKFADDTQFSTKASETSLLTVSVPTGLQFGVDVAAIRVQGSALELQSGKTLGLVGGDVLLEGAYLNSPGGRIELGSVASNNLVNLNPIVNGWSLGYEGVQNFQNIQLAKGNDNEFASEVNASGRAGGDIQIQGKQVILIDGSQIRTQKAETGGNLTVNASESLLIKGSASALVSDTTTAADAGNIVINTRKLLVSDGAFIETQYIEQQESSGLQQVTGRGGNLTVNASESVELINGGVVSSGTQGAGDAGDILLNTSSLVVGDGSRLSTFTRGQGRGGTLTVNASDSVTLAGEDSGLSSATSAAGNAGDVKIVTKNLLVQNNAQASVSSEGTGNAGNLDITADSVRLENQGKLTANSRSVEGGNIRIQDLNLLLLRGNSEIGTDATAGAGNGGNINIDTDLLIGLENSDITATAIAGRGGNIQINTQGIIGIEPRKQRNPATSDITASSERGIDGVVEINRPNVDPNADLVILPAEVVDISGLVAQGCPAGGGKMAASQFVITGRGGLPPNPAEATRTDTVLADLGKPITREENRASAANSINAMHSQPTFLVEVNSWVIGSKGEVVLTATTPNVTDIPWLAPTSCNNS